MSRRILIYRFGQLGDTVAAIPALDAIRQSFPIHEIVILSEKPAGEKHLGPSHVLRGTGIVDTFATYSAASSPLGILKTLSELRALASGGVEALVYLVPSIRPRIKRIRDLAMFRIAGFSKILATRGFPSEPFPRGADMTPSRVQNETDALLKRLALDGIQVPDFKDVQIDLRIQPRERESAEKWLNNVGLSIGSGRRWIAVCPGSKWESKIWPTSRYADIGKLLLEEQGLVPVVVGGKEDSAIARKLIKHWGGGYCAAGELAVRETAALLESATFYLGNDTGAMHLAAAVNCPCVGIFSSLDWPGRWSPYGEIHEVLRHSVPCAGCLAQRCPQNNECLSGISVENVSNACKRILNRPIRTVN